MPEQQIARVTHYFGKIHVAAIDITAGTLAVGDTIHIKGHTTDFTQPVASIELDGKPLGQALPGQSVAIKVIDHARQHDLVYKVVP